MKLRMRSAIPLCVMVAAAALAVARPALAAPEEEARAAQRTEALQQVIRQLEEKSVRPVEKSVLEKDAKRILGQLTAEQVEALAGGERLDRVMPAEQPQLTTADGVQSVVAPAVGDPASDLLFVPVTPCRVIDTRLAGGKVNANEVRSYRIAGTTGFEAQGGHAGGCGIPLGASSPEA